MFRSVFVNFRLRFIGVFLTSLFVYHLLCTGVMSFNNIPCLKSDKSCSLLIMNLLVGCYRFDSISRTLLEIS